MLVDLTLPLNEKTLCPPKPGSETDYPGDSFRETQIETIEEHGVNVNGFSQNTHTGTHMDAGIHYNPDGTPINQLDLELLTGPVQIIDLREYRGKFITADILSKEAGHLESGDRALFLTGDVDYHFHTQEDPKLGDLFKYGSAFSIDAGDWIVERELSLIGNDFVTEAMDIAEGKEFNPNRPVHQRICGADIPIVEYICNVEDVVTEDIVNITCLPLPITGFEASPTRVIAEIGTV